MDSNFSIYLFLIVIGVVTIVMFMRASNRTLKTFRYTAGALAGVNIMFYANYALLCTNSWHDPRISCGNQGLAYMLLILLWCPIILAFLIIAIWWIIRELKEAGNKHAIFKVLIPCVLVALSVWGITLDTFWNPNAYCYEMVRKYEAGLLDEEEEWDDSDSVFTEDSVRIDSTKAVPDTIINP